MHSSTIHKALTWTKPIHCDHYSKIEAVVTNCVCSAPLPSSVQMQQDPLMQTQVVLEWCQNCGGFCWLCCAASWLQFFCQRLLLDLGCLKKRKKSWKMEDKKKANDAIQTLRRRNHHEVVCITAHWKNSCTFGAITTPCIFQQKGLTFDWIIVKMTHFRCGICRVFFF